MILLCPFLPEHLLRNALESVQDRRKYPPSGLFEQRALLLKALAARLAAVISPEDALTLIQKDRYPEEHVMALIELLPKLHEPARDKALREAFDLVENHCPRSIHEDLMIQIAPYLSDSDVKPWLRDMVVKISKQIDRDETTNKFSLMSDVLALELGKWYMYNLDPERLWREARTAKLAKLAPQLARLSPADLDEIWQNLLDTMSRRTRRAWIQDIDAVAPIIEVLGGSAALGKIALTIQQVGREWP
jgi:hypothetical protein